VRLAADGRVFYLECNPRFFTRWPCQCSRGLTSYPSDSLADKKSPAEFFVPCHDSVSQSNARYLAYATEA
jgi:hypothetical protein